MSDSSKTSLINLKSESPRVGQNNLIIENFNATILKNIVQQRQKHLESDSDSSSFSDYEDDLMQKKILSPQLRKINKKITREYSSLSPPIPEFHTRTFKDVGSPPFIRGIDSGSETPDNNNTNNTSNFSKFFKLNIIEVPVRRKTLDVIENSEEISKAKQPTNDVTIKAVKETNYKSNRSSFYNSGKGSNTTDSSGIPCLKIKTLKNIESPNNSKFSNLSDGTSVESQKLELYNNHLNGRLNSLPILPKGILKKSSSQIAIPKIRMIQPLQKRVSFQNIRIDVKKIKNSEIPTFSTNEHSNFF